MHCSHTSITARIHSSTADGHSLPPSFRSSQIGELSNFGENVQACLYAATHDFEIWFSSVFDQGTNPALYRNTETTPILIATSLSTGGNNLSVRRADRRSRISSMTRAFSWENSPVKVMRTPRCLWAWSGRRTGKAAPLCRMLSVATTSLVELLIAEILDLSMLMRRPLHWRYAPTGVMMACMHETASGPLV